MEGATAGVRRLENMINKNTDLQANLGQLHTTELGVMRIRRNLSLDVEDVVGWCTTKIASNAAVITRNGKNWYVTIDNCIITINTYSYTIITVLSARVQTAAGPGSVLTFGHRRDCLTAHFTALWFC